MGSPCIFLIRQRIEFLTTIQFCFVNGQEDYRLHCPCHCHLVSVGRNQLSILCSSFLMLEMISNAFGVSDESFLKGGHSRSSTRELSIFLEKLFLSLLFALIVQGICKKLLDTYRHYCRFILEGQLVSTKILNSQTCMSLSSL